MKGRGGVTLVFVALLLSVFPAVGGAESGERAWTLDGAPCHLIEVPRAGVRLAAPVGTFETCPGVRPGAIVTSAVGQCTFNFMWRGSDGRTYMGTAGHCILPSDGQEKKWAVGRAPVARDADGRRIGEFAYAVLKDPKDFSLVRLDRGVAASPQMCHFGGPTGVNADRTSPPTPVVLEQFGQGVLVGSIVPARTYVALGLPDPDHINALGVALPGDSGSGMMSSDGRAVGVLVTLGIGTEAGQFGDVGITRIAPQIKRASAVTGISFALRTAPQL